MSGTTQSMRFAPQELDFGDTAHGVVWAQEGDLDWYRALGYAHTFDWGGLDLIKEIEASCTNITDGESDEHE